MRSLCKAFWCLPHRTMLSVSLNLRTDLCIFSHIEILNNRVWLHGVRICAVCYILARGPCKFPRYLPGRNSQSFIDIVGYKSVGKGFCWVQIDFRGNPQRPLWAFWQRSDDILGCSPLGTKPTKQLILLSFSMRFCLDSIVIGTRSKSVCLCELRNSCSNKTIPNERLYTMMRFLVLLC